MYRHNSLLLLAFYYYIFLKHFLRSRNIVLNNARAQGSCFLCCPVNKFCPWIFRDPFQMKIRLILDPKMTIRHWKCPKEFIVSIRDPSRIQIITYAGCTMSSETSLNLWGNWKFENQHSSSMKNTNPESDAAPSQNSLILLGINLEETQQIEE